MKHLILIIFLIISLNSLKASIYKKCNYWNETSSGISSSLNGVVYGGNKFVAVGDSGEILTSEDKGTTWIRRNSGSNNSLNAVAYGLNKFIAVGIYGTALSSTDGITWSTINNVGGHGEDILFGNNIFVVVGRDDFVSVSSDETNGLIIIPTIVQVRIEWHMATVYGCTLVTVAKS